MYKERKINCKNPDIRCAYTKWLSTGSNKRNLYMSIKIRYMYLTYTLYV